MRTRPKRLALRALGLLMGALIGGGVAVAQAGPGNPDEDPPPQWRFREADKPVKVVVLAGSVGAYKRNPYAKRIEDMCTNVEVENISAAGYGAWALKRRFQQQVIKNPRVNLRDPNFEYWLVFQGGLNSVATPEKANRHIRDLFLMAHRRGVRVVGFSLTPWGKESDKRWAGPSGLYYQRNTQKVVDYVVGRSEPREALGVHVEKRTDPEAPWDPSELADIGIDLYDSPLRARDTPPRDVEAMRKALSRDNRWKRRHADLDEQARAEALEADAASAAAVPTWYMRPELHAFDHIHPNEEGHRLIAEIACPQLPENWGCACPNPADVAAPEPAAEQQ